MSAVRCPFSFEIVRFRCKDKSENTFRYVAAPAAQHHKDSKVFAKSNTHFRGHCVNRAENSIFGHSFDSRCLRQTYREKCGLRLVFRLPYATFAENKSARLWNLKEPFTK